MRRFAHLSVYNRAMAFSPSSALQMSELVLRSKLEAPFIQLFVKLSGLES
jgi:hypothetical protein